MKVLHILLLVTVMNATYAAVAQGQKFSQTGGGVQTVEDFVHKPFYMDKFGNFEIGNDISDKIVDIINKVLLVTYVVVQAYIIISIIYAWWNGDLPIPPIPSVKNIHQLLPTLEKQLGK
ncbi:unnamed protein product [Moneuplotes crassus]|uniref:Uncharacterized protein n=1 Tax=Euplotes crassus TaxID=5936 RepID=A0AAD1Y422_EUPCR|nr:unnamed protein product [Moneuplotes crassus]